MQNHNLKFKNKKFLKTAIDFHGHLGPYLVLGILMGESAINKYKFRRYFGTEIFVKGVDKKPKSCLIDGLQISTGCTYGKGNIHKLNGKRIEVEFINTENRKKLEIFFNEDLIKKLNNLKGHRDSELFAQRILRFDPTKLFGFKF